VASKRVVVVGASNTDIVGRSFAPLAEQASNPGYVHLSHGGTGRNIAENLARLGLAVEFVTALGGDHNARHIVEHCRGMSINMDRVLIVPELPGPLHITVLDDAGQLSVALDDMRALERLTPSALAERSEAFGGADLVVLDANLDSDSLAWVAGECSAPLLLDPVSAVKAPAARGIVGQLAAVKCSAEEAGALLGTDEPRSRVEIEHAAQRLLELGVVAAYVTAGAGGAYFASEDQRGWVHPPRVGVARASGAGDAFSAGVAAGMVEGYSAKRCAMLGTVLAGFALSSEHTVSERVGREAVWDAMRELDE